MARNCCIALLMLLIGAATVQRAVAAPSRLNGVKSFAYQLQGIAVDELAASPFDVIIIDYSFDGSNRRALKAADVSAIRAGRANRKVLAYLSIGEAESYRYYFSSAWVQSSGCSARPSRKAPRWLDSPNPSFCDNFKVRFWEPSWRKVLFTKEKGPKGYLDRIISAGFDGVYLDIIDGFRYFDREEGNGSRPGAAKDMAKLVLAIAKHARTVRKVPNFIVVPQNGSDILDELPAKTAAKYLDAIDGIGAEDTFYFGDEDENNNLDPQTDVITNLQKFVLAGRPVLAIDYLTDAAKRADFISRACGAGFIPQVSTRELDTIASHVSGGCE